MNTWEDTVMSNKGMLDAIPHWIDVGQSIELLMLTIPEKVGKYVAKAQAELTWKARDSEVAEARKAGKAAWAVFQEIDELVSDIEGDWTDPRYECGKISKLIGEWFREWGIKE